MKNITIKNFYETKDSIWVEYTDGYLEEIANTEFNKLTILEKMEEEYKEAVKELTTSKFIPFSTPLSLILFGSAITASIPTENNKNGFLVGLALGTLGLLNLIPDAKRRKEYEELSKYKLYLDHKDILNSNTTNEYGYSTIEGLNINEISSMTLEELQNRLYKMENNVKKLRK